ncbi:MAG: MGMT family protein [Terriglobales bacterium]
MAAGGKHAGGRRGLGRPAALGPLPADGPSAFWARVQRVVRRVPRGRVATYGQIAALAGRPGAARQVARALRGGRLLPWHRVVAAGGRIALPGEAGWEQRLRLEREGVRFRGRRVKIEDFYWRNVRGKGAAD